MKEPERLLVLLDALREQIAAGLPVCYLFAWSSPPVPLDAAPGRMPAELNVPFIAPPPDATVHLLLTFGPDGAKVIADHERVAAAYVPAATAPG